MKDNSHKELIIKRICVFFDRYISSDFNNNNELVLAHQYLEHLIRHHNAMKRLEELIEDNV